MAITVYWGSGSPPSWRVLLALEHKALPYESKLLSFAAGDLRKADYLAINPRGRVPAIVDDGFTLFEATAIVDYLEARYPDAPSLFPRDPRGAALARRIELEVDSYLFPAGRRLLQETIFRRDGNIDPAAVADARRTVEEELARFASYLDGPCMVGNALSAADFAVYTNVALIRRVSQKQPANGAAIPDALTSWMKTIEALPYHEKTYPPHWREG
jgi:glutathione S-transferase